MDLHLKAKHALITGGSKGIGLACAQRFLQEDACVTLVGRSADSLAMARQALLASFPDADSRIATHACDLKDAVAARELIERVDEVLPIDILVNSAGAARRTAAGELTPSHWEEAMQAKFFPCINAIDPLIKRMAARGAGVVVNVAGRGGKVPSPIHLPGGAANAALMLVSAGLAAAYGPSGIRVNAVNPGLTRTDRMEQGLQVEAALAGITTEEALARASTRMPLGRIATADEVADAVVFLCSSRASYISGAILAVDGAVSPMVV